MFSGGKDRIKSVGALEAAAYAGSMVDQPGMTSAIVDGDDDSIARGVKEVVIGVEGEALSAFTMALATAGAHRLQSSPNVWQLPGGGPALRVHPSKFSALVL